MFVEMFHANSMFFTVPRKLKIIKIVYCSLKNHLQFHCILCICIQQLILPVYGVIFWVQGKQRVQSKSASQLSRSESEVSGCPWPSGRERRWVQRPQYAAGRKASWFTIRNGFKISSIPLKNTDTQVLNAIFQFKYFKLSHW